MNLLIYSKTEQMISSLINCGNTNIVSYTMKYQLVNYITYGVENEVQKKQKRSQKRC